MSGGEILNIGGGSGQNSFKLQMARDGAANDVEIDMATLATFNESPYFWQDTDGQSVNMRVRVDGATTSAGSSNPRCELREMAKDGTTMLGFDASVGEHWIRGKTRVDHLPPMKPSVVVAQVHSTSSDQLTIALQPDTSTTPGVWSAIRLLYRVRGTSSGLTRFADSYVLGTEFEWMLRVINGGWEVYYNDMTTPFATSAQYSADAAKQLLLTEAPGSWMLKAGCYSQTNETVETDPTEYCQVRLRHLAHWHSGREWAKPLGYRNQYIAPVNNAASPAAITAGSSNTMAGGLASSAFSPPANSVIVVCAMVNESGTGTNRTVTVTDSVGQTYTQAVRRAKLESEATSGAGVGYVGIWTALCPTARTNMTVTVTPNDATNNRTHLKVYVVTGADLADVVGAINSGTLDAVTVPATLTPELDNSLLFLAALDWRPGPGLTSTPLTEVSSGATTNISSGAGYRTGLAGGDAMDMTFAVASGATNGQWQWVAAEIRGLLPTKPPGAYLAAST